MHKDRTRPLSPHPLAMPSHSGNKLDETESSSYHQQLLIHGLASCSRYPTFKSFACNTPLLIGSFKLLFLYLHSVYDLGFI